MKGIVLKGDLIWTESPERFSFIENGYLKIEEGKIESVSKEKPLGEYSLLDFTGSLIVPGLSDIHMHAPQYQYAGLYMDEELLEWLNKHTFPQEARYKDLSYAEKAYSSFVEDLAHSSTTRASIFATIHKDSTILLMKLLEERGLAGYVGKVSMDRNSPDILIEDTKEAINSEIAFIEEASIFKLVRPIVTPRFIPSCTDELMRALTRLAKAYDAPIQSHLDENLSEIDWIKELCPDSKSYSDAYRLFGAFDVKSIMAHVVWPDDEEIKMLKSYGVYVAHAPSSNMNLSSGIAPIRKMIAEGVNVALATDVAGGSSLSMFRAITDAIQCSKLRWRLVDDAYSPLRFSEAFYLASKSGGSFFGKVGSFEKGYDADVLVIDDKQGASTLYHELTIPERLEFYAYRHPDDYISAKFVCGRRII